MLRIGVVGYTNSAKYNPKLAMLRLHDAFKSIAKNSKHNDVVIVAGVTDIGINSQAYRLAKQYGFITGGVACELAHDYKVFNTDEEPVIIGQMWGDESSVFIRGISSIPTIDKTKIERYRNHPHYGLDILIKIGGGSQAAKEVSMMKDLKKPVYEYEQ